MADAPEQIDFSIEDLDKKDDKPDDVEIVKADEVVEPSRNKVVDIDEGLEALKAQLESERYARIEAEKRAQQANESAFKAKNEVQDSNLHLVNNAIATMNQTNDILKSHYREAMSINDYDRASEIQHEMATNAAKLLQLKQGKEALENTPKQSAPRAMPSDPVEALASQLSPRSAEWVRRNPQCVTDQRMYQKMIAAHNLAAADGIPFDSDDYFAAIESTLRINRNDSQTAVEDPMSSSAKPTQKRSSPPAAPVSRSGNGTGARPNTVRLTSAEREMASMMGMTDQDYAKNKLALQREGKLN
jgi:hypothetical protein